MQVAATLKTDYHCHSVVDSICGYTMIDEFLSTNCQETKILWCYIF